MGGKQSKNKRFHASDTLRQFRRNNEYFAPIDPDDPLNDPTYHLQGEPDTYNNETPDSDDIWVPREGSDATCKTLDDGDCEHNSGQLVYRETVLHGPAHESFQSDHYDVITDSDLEESQTELKQVNVTTNRSNTVQPSLYHRLPLQSPQTNRRQRRPDYEYMVQIFQPLLVANVIVRHLLPHLPFLSNPDMIRAIEERDPRAAVIYLIDEICSNSNTEPGRWKQFIQALEICGYKFIVDTLRGQDPVDHTYQREYLKIITPILRELIYPLELLPGLWAVDVISNEDREEISRLERNWGPLRAADKLLDLVPRRHKHWYSHLVHALRTVGKTEAAEMLAIPEILSFDGEDDMGCKKQTSTDNNKESSVRHVTEIDSPTGPEHILTEDRTKTEIDTGVKIVPDNCEYLDCDNCSDTETEELDDLYMYMRTGRNLDYFPLSRENMYRNTPAESQTGDMHEEFEVYEEMAADLSSTVNASSSRTLLNSNSQSKTSNTLDEGRSNMCGQNLVHISRTLIKYGKNGMELSASIIEHGGSNRSDVYRYEPPLPAAAAPEVPEQQDDKVQDSFHNEIDTDNCTAEVKSETNSVEVIALSVPTPKKSRYYDYTANPRIQTLHNKSALMNKGDLDSSTVNTVDTIKAEEEEEIGVDTKGINKPPKPVPRKQSVVTLPVPPRGKKYYEYPSNGMNKLPKPTPRIQTSQNRIFLNKGDLDKATIGKTDPFDETEEVEINITDDDETHEKKTTADFIRNLSDISKSPEEDKLPSLKTDRRRLNRAKFKISVLKRKSKCRKNLHSKLNSRRKPLNVLPNCFQEAKSPHFDRGKALINRNRMPTPKLNRQRNIQPEERSRSNSLPHEYRQSVNIQNSNCDLKQFPGTECNKDATNSLPLYYSEPFRSHRGKEDEDIFTTVGQVVPDRQSGNDTQFTKVNSVLLSHPKGKTHWHVNQRRMSDTDELLDILKSCNTECKADDYVLKSAADIKMMTKDSLNPVLRKDLEKVRDMKQKLNDLIHGESVLKKRLQLQEDVNEVLKQHRQLSSKLSVREKEALALEAAIAGDTSDLGDVNFVPYNSEEICVRFDLPRKEQRLPLENNSVSKDNDSLAAEALGATGNNLIEAEVKRKLKDSDKDSAFYSEFTKL